MTKVTLSFSDKGTVALLSVEEEEEENAPLGEQAVISKAQFRRFLDELYERGDYKVAASICESNLTKIEPFATWIAEWNNEGF